MKDVSVILVNYNTAQMTAECIDSIFAQTSGVDFEVIVSDNASKDGSRERLGADPRIRYIYNDGNLGFGRGNNEAIKIAEGRYLFLLNTDTLLLNNAIKTFYDYEEAHGGSLVLGCMMQDREGRPTSSFGDLPTPCNALKGVLKGFIFNEFKFPVTDAAEKDVEMIVGADMFIPRAAFDAAGDFDPDFFMYFEEADLQKRMAQAGFRARIIGGPQIVHFGGASDPSPEKAARMRYNYSESLFTYMRKHCSRIGYAAFRAAYAAIRVLPAAIKREDRATKRKFIKLLFS